MTSRLERIAAFTKQSEAQIVHMQSPHGPDTYLWLCAEAVARRLAAGWTHVDPPREPGHPLGCQEHDACVRERAIARAEADAARVPKQLGDDDEVEF